jgi:hypothetical protein
MSSSCTEYLTAIGRGAARRACRSQRMRPRITRSSTPVIQITPAQAGAIAIARLRLPTVAPGIGPSPDLNRWKMAAVGYPLWLWADGPTRAGPVSDSVGGLSVSLEARVSSPTFRIRALTLVLAAIAHAAGALGTRARGARPGCGRLHERRHRRPPGDLADHRPKPRQQRPHQAAADQPDSGRGVGARWAMTRRAPRRQVLAFPAVGLSQCMAPVHDARRAVPGARPVPLGDVRRQRCRRVAVNANARVTHRSATAGLRCPVARRRRCRRR